MKIAFYLPNKDYSQIDCSHPDLGNPGIGGTEYMIISIPYYMEKLYHGTHEYVLFANCVDKLPQSIKALKVNGLNEVPKMVEKERIDLLVLKYSLDTMQSLLKGNVKLNVAFWTHNFIKRQELTKLAHEHRVKAIICVGNEQLQIYRDHKAYYKSVVLLNGYPIEAFKTNDLPHVKPFAERGPEVTYMGNLVSYKGFPLLARAWKSILKRIPDAQLNVIGGGALYNRNSRLGKWGLAEEEDEAAFMPYLLDENGKLLPSVKFWGIMGKEKNEVLNRTKVGVPNPGGVSETFCITALEMQLWGSVIATIRFGGFLDTVYSTGILYKNVNELADAVIAQLQRTDNDYPSVLNFMAHFSFESICRNWIKFFNALAKGEDISNLLKPAPSPHHQFEEMNRKLKAVLPLGHYLPTKMFYRSILLRIPILKRYA